MTTREGLIDVIVRLILYRGAAVDLGDIEQVDSAQYTSNEALYSNSTGTDRWAA